MGGIEESRGLSEKLLIVGVRWVCNKPGASKGAIFRTFFAKNDVLSFRRAYLDFFSGNMGSSSV